MNANVPSDNDKSLLIELMSDSINNRHSLADSDKFNDKRLAETYNKFFDKFINGINSNALSLNDAMNIIGNVENVRKMLESSREQKDYVEEANHSIDELIQTVDFNSKTIHEIYSFVESAVQNSQNTVKDISESMNFVDVSFNRISEVNSQISAIQDHVGKIYEIISTVKTISRQTNMLSINASIEAARAGQAGKGFAVVADEVRRLADITGKSAEGINEKIESLQADIRNILSAIENTTGELNKSKELVGNTITEISEIFETMRNINKQMNDVFDANKKQNSIINDFLQEVKNISHHANNLHEYCGSAGLDLHKISRAVDKVRGNLAREQANLSEREWVRVFITDHVIYTWRLFNMITGFETLEISMINNHRTCKLGLWYNKITDSKILNNRDFIQIEAHHKKLHEKAVECVTACNKNNHEQAMRCFNEALPIMNNLIDCLAKVERLL